MRGPESSIYNPTFAAMMALAQQRRTVLEDDLAILLLERQKRQEAIEALLAQPIPPKARSAQEVDNLMRKYTRNTSGEVTIR
jgi:hypothetical protein